MVIADLVSLKGIWTTLFMTCLVFGFAPGAVLRLLVLLLPKPDYRREELVAELYTVPRLERPVWVAQQAETCLFEGVSQRWKRYQVVKSTEDRRRFYMVRSLISYGVFAFVFMVGMGCTLYVMHSGTTSTWPLTLARIALYPDGAVLAYAIWREWQWLRAIAKHRRQAGRLQGN